MLLAQAKVFYYDFVEIKPWIYELVISNLGLAFVGTKIVTLRHLSLVSILITF